MRSIFLLLAMMLTLSGVYAFEAPADILEAREMIDELPLSPIEGLWRYPDDDVTVLIINRENISDVYDIYVVEAADCSLKAGMKLGELHSSPDPMKFEMNLYTQVKKGVLSVPGKAVATFSRQKEALTFKKSSINIRLRPNYLLPSFWRIVQVNIKPGEKAPEGMIKVYPSYDGNGSTRRAPRYL